MNMKLREHRFLGMTQSLCPECLAVIPAKIIVKRAGRVYFRKRCPTHGVREDFICSDVSQYDRMEFSLPGKAPKFGVEPDKGCPLDCGLCTEHEQHTCVGLLEITAACNLTCPTCFSASGPGLKHLTVDECRRAIDRLVEVETRPEVLQLSGGEPTIHPQFAEILEYACAQPIDVVMVNTNGIRLAHDPVLIDYLGNLRDRVQIYLQFDGLTDSVYQTLRGEPLAQIKLRAVENLGRVGLRTTLVTTLEPGVNEHEIGAIVQYGLERPWITGISFQPTTYSGRYMLPETLERRITFPDVVREIARQTNGLYREDDFLPLPCAHPNCHTLSYAYRSGGRVVPLSRFIDARKHLDLLANGITFTRLKARELIERFLVAESCCDVTQASILSGHHTNGAHSASAIVGSGGVTMAAPYAPATDSDLPSLAAEFFTRATTEQLAAEDVFRITITSFLDAYNFDVRRVMKCCIHHLLPSGHIIPFCAYNVLYRNGHVPLPTLRALSILTPSSSAPLVAGREPG